MSKPEELPTFIPSPQALEVISKRYVRKLDGVAIESLDEMFWRVASHVAQLKVFGSPDLNQENLELAKAFYIMMVEKRFIPNSPTFTGAGTSLQQLAACFVLPVEDDLVGGQDAIFSTLRNAVAIQQTGGGNGFSFGRLREKGARVTKSEGLSSGPISFIKAFDAAFGSVAQGGTRRGANMAILPVDHPDIYEFVSCKATEGNIANFNISVGITDAFMNAVRTDDDFSLISRYDSRVVKKVRARELFDHIVQYAHRNGEPGCVFLDTINRQNPVPSLYTLEATNPCVTADTIINTPKGDYPVRDLIGKVCELGVDQNYVTTLGFFHTGTKPVYKITTNSKRATSAFIRTTANHQLLYSIDGRMVWGETSKARVGDVLITDDGDEATVTSIVADGVEDVYDVQVPGINAYTANGFISHNCGEQSLGPYENCCLGSIHLGSHIIESDGIALVDWTRLQETIVNATRFLDNVVSVNGYVESVPQLRKAAEQCRRIGLGIMGLADAMYLCEVRYGSAKGCDFGAQIMEFVRYHAMLTSIQLAKEKGPFLAIKQSIYSPEAMTWTPPQYQARHHFGRPAIDWELVVEGIKTYGIRNAAQTTIAPTGTIATISGCEGYGCEPVFALGYVRYFDDGGIKRKLNYLSPIFLDILKKEGLQMDEIFTADDGTNFFDSWDGSCQNLNKVPKYIRDIFVVSGDISAEEHITMQAALQIFVDNAISKTCNFPAGTTTKEVAHAYMTAWERGCKGITVYVTGSRDVVVLETAATQKKDMPAEKQAIKPTNSLLEIGPSVAGTTHRIRTATGNMHVIVNDLEDEACEVFIIAAKSGTDVQSDAEAIGRLISYSLRLPSPITRSVRLASMLEQLSGIGGSSSIGLGKNKIKSLPDGIANAILRHSSGGVNQAKQVDQAKSSGKFTGQNCPSCGACAMIRVEGCIRCTNCSHSEC
jgi:ribonucleotide reductase alpha subunit